MQRWAQRSRNLVLLGVLLAGIVGIASVVTTPWGGKSVSEVSRPVEMSGSLQEQVDAGKKEVMPPDSVPGSVGETVRTRVKDGERWVDVF